MNKVDTRIKILNLLEKGDLGVTKISLKLKFSKQITHRYVKDLVADNFLLKKGNSPHTTYSLNPKYKYTRARDDFEFAKENLIKIFKKKYKGIKIKNHDKDNHDLDFMLKSSAVYSSNIEGVSIDLNSFMNMKDVLSKGAQKEVSEVQDLLNAYDFAKNNKLTHGNFLKIHKLSSKHILSISRQGKYRSEGVGVFGKEGLVYSAMEGFLVNNEMNILFSIIDELLRTKMSTFEIIFWASWIHLEIALIHPFLDGNGRSARLIEKWFLAEKLDKTTWFLQTELYYFKKRDKYYSSLRKGDNYWELKMNRFESFIDILFSFIK